MRRASVMVALGAFAMLGCMTEPNLAYCDAATPCRDPARPVCDSDGAAGLPHACVASLAALAPSGAAGAPIYGLDLGAGPVSFGCSHGAGKDPPTRCEQEFLVDCRASAAVVTACPLGCLAQDSVARCHQMVAPNLSTIDLARTGGDLVLGGTVTIDTDAGVGGHPDLAFMAAPQDGGPTAAVLAVREFTIMPGARVRVRGSRALVVAASGAIAIAGVLDASSAADGTGPGVRVSEAGDGGVTTGSSGSGAGYGDFGGGAAGVGAATGGARYGTRDLTPLLGGATGGSTGARSGGAGGGAIELVSLRSVRIAVGGAVLAGGAGGRGEPSKHGSGGGSGGAILLAARGTITVLGTLAANGGGGSGVGTSGARAAGQAGLAGFMPAAGGFAADTSTVPCGGSGGARDHAAEPGRAATLAGGPAGLYCGGGGAVGKIDVLVGEGQQYDPDSGTQSPRPDWSHLRIR
jgi:hypothetical protein